jgi:hypothetical protein
MIRNLDCASDREERLNEVLLAYMDEFEAGRTPARQQLLKQHPDLRPDLEAFFAGHDEIERLVAPLREPSRTESELGQLGDYRLLRELGRGGMGIVYEAEQISLQRRVALKILPFAAALDPRRLQRFKNEALAAAHLRHENIVPVYAVGCEHGIHYFAMQLIQGRSLATLIELRRGSSRDRADFDWAARLCRQAALALEHAHQTGIVHRDVKPANLLLDQREQIWVTDFGVAQGTGDAGLTMTGEFLGTLRYVSPEQARARRGIVDHRSDIYSLGATLYELLTLRPLFDGRDQHELLRQIADDEPVPPGAVISSVPTELETIVLKALRKDPGERYATAQELADDLERFLDHRPVLARRPTLLERLRKWVWRHPSFVAAGMGVLLVVSAGSLVSAALISREQRRTQAEQQRAEEAYRRERQRAEEAEERFRLARRSVNELIRVSEEELANRPGMEWVRKRLLMSALAYYQEFVEQRRDDPDTQAELLDTTHRVEKILADLAVLRSASQFYLLCQPSVLDDLRLSKEQRVKMKPLMMRIGKQWMDSFADAARLSSTERGRRALVQACANEAEVRAILTPAQQARLPQIGSQAQGPGAFREPDVVAALQLTIEQREQIRVIEDDWLFAWLRATRPGMPVNQPPDPKAGPCTERILALLTGEQLQRWHRLTGEPVKGLVGPFGPVVAPRRL